MEFDIETSENTHTIIQKENALKKHNYLLLINVTRGLEKGEEDDISKLKRIPL